MAVISLDYDRTYTADPELWDAFIALAQSRGHTLICITMRTNPFAFSIPVYCTAGIAKVPWAEQHGIKVDIWIDDQPWRLIENALSN